MRRRFRGVPPALLVLYADTFTMAVGFYMLIPLLAYHLLADLALSVAVVGVLAALRSASQQGLMPWSGALADRVGHRRAILAGVLIRAAGFGLLGVVESVPALALACVLTGVGGSLFHPASYAAYAILSADRDRVTVYATREMLSNLGFVIGPAVGGALASVRFTWVCLGAACLFGAAFLLTLLGLPRELSGTRSERVRLRSVAGRPEFVRFCVLAAAMWLLVSQLYLAVPVRARAVLTDTVGIGAVYSAAALVMVAVMLPLNRFAGRRMGAGATLAWGVGGLGAGLAVMGWWDSAAGLFAGVAAFTVGQVLVQPVMNAVVAGFAEGDGVASYFGVHGLALAVGGVLGNVGGGLLYRLAETSTVWWAVPPAWALIVAVAALRSDLHT